MRLKEVDGKLVPPPAVYTTEDGKTIFNMAQSPELCDLYGWPDRTQEWIDQWHKDHPQPEPSAPPEQTVFSKLAIRRAMRTLGIEAKLDALLAANAIFRAD